MSPKAGTKVKECGSGEAKARLGVAESFMNVADIAEAMNDARSPYHANALVTNYVMAGIAATDAICCLELKKHSVGEHNDAVLLLRTVKPDGATLARALGILLGVKNEVSYGSSPVKRPKRYRAKRAAEQLVQAARDRAVAG